MIRRGRFRGESCGSSSATRSNAVWTVCRRGLMKPPTAGLRSGRVGIRGSSFTETSCRPVRRFHRGRRASSRRSTRRWSRAARRTTSWRRRHFGIMSRRVIIGRLTVSRALNGFENGLMVKWLGIFQLAGVSPARMEIGQGGCCIMHFEDLV